MRHVVYAIHNDDACMQYKSSCQDICESIAAASADMHGPLNVDRTFNQEIHSRSQTNKNCERNGKMEYSINRRGRREFLIKGTSAALAAAAGGRWLASTTTGHFGRGLCGFHGFDDGGTH